MQFAVLFRADILILVAVLQKAVPAKSIIFNAKFRVFDKEFRVFDTKFLVFDTESLVLNAKFIICTPDDAGLAIRRPWQLAVFPLHPSHHLNMVSVASLL